MCTVLQKTIQTFLIAERTLFRRKHLGPVHGRVPAGAVVVFEVSADDVIVGKSAENTGTLVPETLTSQAELTENIKDLKKKLAKLGYKNSADDVIVRKRAENTGGTLAHCTQNPLLPRQCRRKILNITGKYLLTSQQRFFSELK